MKKSGILAFLLAVAVICSAQSAMAATKWRAVTHSMPGTEQQKIVEDFCKTVEVLSEGELIIEPYAAGVLFPVFETFDNLANGVVDMGMVYGAYWPGKDPGFVLQTRPGCPLSTYAEGAYLDEKLFSYMDKLYAKHRMKYLGHFMNSPLKEQLMSVVPLKGIADIKGKKIRTSGFGALYYRALGATTVSLSAPEIYTAFQTKNIDAAEWTFWDENMRMGFHEVVKYVVDPAFQNGTCEYFPLVVNPAKWDALPQHLKDIVLVARDQARYRSAMVYVAEVKAREVWKNNKNIEIISWSPEDEAKAREVGMGLILAEANKTAEGKEYLRIYRETLFELGYKKEAAVLGHKAAQ